MNIIHYSNKQDCDAKAVEILQQSITKLLQTQPFITLAIPGGRSVSGIFEELIHTDIQWTKVHIFMIDERIVDINDPESNYRLARESFIRELIEKGLLPEDNVHPFIVEEGVELYQKKLAQFGGKFDIILVSSGEDGHIAGLFPNHHSIKDQSLSFITMDDSPKPPPQRMTASAQLIKKSQIAIILFYGTGKRQAYQKFNDPKITVEESPNKLVLQIPECHIITDLEE